MKACFVYLAKPSHRTPDRLEGVKLMCRILEELGYDKSKCRSVYLTQADGSKKISASEITANREKFIQDVGDEPVILVAMGAQAMTPLTKGYYNISNVRGEPMPVTDDMPYPKGSLVYGMFDPLAVWNNPGCEDLFRRDLRHLVALINDTPEKDPDVDNIIIHSAEDLNTFTDYLPKIMDTLPELDKCLVVDCEWQGRNWKEPGRYIRTIQVGYAPGHSITIELYKENDAFSDPEMKWPRKSDERARLIAEKLAAPVYMCSSSEKEMWAAIKRLLQDSKYPIVGHNVIADWQWLLSFGVDIRRNVVYDTMLAEHLINSDGPFRLDEVAMRRTPYGRYSAGVDVWVQHHKEFCKEGYGAVPSDLLMPYGGADVDCPRMIMKAQMPILQEYGMLDPRGHENE